MPVIAAKPTTKTNFATAKPPRKKARTPATESEPEITLPPAHD